MSAELPEKTTGSVLASSSSALTTGEEGRDLVVRAHTPQTSGERGSPTGLILSPCIRRLLCAPLLPSTDSSVAAAPPHSNYCTNSRGMCLSSLLLIACSDPIVLIDTPGAAHPDCTYSRAQNFRFLFSSGRQIAHRSQLKKKKMVFTLLYVAITSKACLKSHCQRTYCSSTLSPSATVRPTSLSGVRKSVDARADISSVCW